ncbi:MAG: hypothetical protein KAX49_09130 [Halanaerobiales bacterium]|nr:hypothetical protein [Halanaerobiales bacterium]
MATATFDKKIIITNEAADVLIKGLSRSKPKFVSDIDVEKELERSRSLLKQL